MPMPSIPAEVRSGVRAAAAIRAAPDTGASAGTAAAGSIALSAGPNWSATEGQSTSAPPS